MNVTDVPCIAGQKQVKICGRVVALKGSPMSADPAVFTFAEELPEKLRSMRKKRNAAQ
jgi:hypothetical protein